MEEVKKNPVYELDSSSIRSTPSQLSLAAPSSLTATSQQNGRVVSSYAPGQRQQPHPQPATYRPTNEGPYRLSHVEPHRVTAKRGKLIAFEGLDRSGKSTQCALLAERLRERGERVEHMRFPNRSTPIGQLINGYLTGESGAEDHVIHLLFSANRWESAPEIERLIHEGVTVVVDRYYYSGCVYSAAKMITGLGLEWARHPDVGLPRPDLCIFLDVGPDTVQQRGGFGEEIYERREMQGRVRELFEVMMKHPDEENDIVVVNADRNIDEVERTIQKWVRLASERVDKKDLPLEHVQPW